MAYKLKINEDDIVGKEFINQNNRSECVELVKQATGAPQTTKWKKGKNVMKSSFNEILKGTAIATFSDSGGYKGHAAIYISHSQTGITVYDQWVDDKSNQNKPTSLRIIRSRGVHPQGRMQNIAESYYVIE